MDMEEKKENSNNRGDVVMKLEHLLQAYKVNNIEAKLKEMNDKQEKAGTIKFTNGISASYLLDNENIVLNFLISY